MITFVLGLLSGALWWAGFLAVVPYAATQLLLRLRDFVRHSAFVQEKLKGIPESARSVLLGRLGLHGNVGAHLRAKYSKGPRLNVWTTPLAEAVANRRDKRNRESAAAASAAGGPRGSSSLDYAPAAGCQWALVTGASSGVGLELVKLLARGGFSVVMVALPDELLDAAHSEVVKEFGGKSASSKKDDDAPRQEFRKVGANLGKHTDSEDYMTAIADACDDIDVQVICLNAGFLVAASLARTAEGLADANYECNVTCPTRMARFFMTRLVESGLPGCITFTSSAQGLTPLPAAALYTAGKAYVSTLAASLFAEGAAHGIDICSIQSGPIATRFSENLPDVAFARFTNMIADPPEVIADVLLSSVGVVCWRDSSLYTAINRLLMRVLDVNVLAGIIGFALPYSKEFKQDKKFG